MERTTDGVHIADATLVLVGLAAYGGRPSRVPGAMRDAIAGFEGLPDRRMRVWGEDAGLLGESGADVAALAALEEGLAASFAGLPREGAIDAHVHIGRDADGHALDADALVADLDRWGIASAVCFPANEPGEDGCFGAANAAVRAAARRTPAGSSPSAAWTRCAPAPWPRWRPRPPTAPAASSCTRWRSASAPRPPR